MSGDLRPQVSLASVFERLIVSHGPISVSQFMGESNTRYYGARDPLGEQGDFITAPEISQMFGEFIGLWLADMWVKAGRVDQVQYVELGPGRGTLTKDVLSVTGRYGLEPKVHFVETSMILRDIQLAQVPQAQFHDDLSTVSPYGPVLIVANEFLDALPIRQLVSTEQGWRERMVGWQDGKFAYVAGDKPMDSAVPEALRGAAPGTIVETSPGAAATAYEIAGRLVKQGGAALLIDYGHDAPRTGSTLQAVRQHRMVDPLAMPGEADLTAHVDFAALAPIAESRGARWLGTVAQGHWLRHLGIEVRAERLARIAPEHREAIFSAMERLTGEGQMGALFKVMGLAGPDWRGGEGF
jgi:NADH dehydrogenase [ubiquinone] 1 alpha subcomplex assembly factor 7